MFSGYTSITSSDPCRFSVEATLHLLLRMLHPDPQVGPVVMYNEFVVRALVAADT
jgi:hypothetical protein